MNWEGGGFFRIGHADQLIGEFFFRLKSFQMYYFIRYWNSLVRETGFWDLYIPMNVFLNLCAISSC